MKICQANQVKHLMMNILDFVEVFLTVGSVCPQLIPFRRF